MSPTMRYLISFVAALWLLWFAAPRLPIYGSDIQFGFSLLWLAFCFLVIGANLHALLRVGRGEQLQRPRPSPEQKEAIRRLEQAQKRRRRMTLN